MWWPFRNDFQRWSLGWRSGDYGAARAERIWQRRLIGFANFRIALARNQQQKDLPWAKRRL